MTSLSPPRRAAEGVAIDPAGRAFLIPASAPATVAEASRAKYGRRELAPRKPYAEQPRGALSERHARAHSRAIARVVPLVGVRRSACCA
jgi:hypothetical protein